MKMITACVGVFAASLLSVAYATTPLGLPPVPEPKNNPVTPDKVKLGDKLFHDQRFSADGTVSCATCHDQKKAFTDSPRKVSQGIAKLTGTRNAPTVINAAYMHTQFWDGREPDLEGQSGGPFINPVEMGLPNYEPILKLVRSDPEYQALFKQAFNSSGEKIDFQQVRMAIASFERTIIAGDSPFDRYYFGGDKSALSDAAVRGFKVYLEQGRCVSCHTISQTHALFSDSRFHNLGVGFGRINKDAKELAIEFKKMKMKVADVDMEVLTNKNTSELGRYAVTTDVNDIGAFKTPTLRNVAKTAPYMHDGSVETLKDVVKFYNNGGRVSEKDPVYDFQSGGIRPLNLSDDQIDDLVAFLESLTSPEYE